MKRQRTVLACAAAALATMAPLAEGAAAELPNVLPDVPITGINLTHQASQNSPVIAVDPTDERFVVVASRIDGPSAFGCALQVSGDAGRGWIPARPVPDLPEGVEHCYAPEVAFDRTGRIYYLFVGLAGAGNSPVGAYLTSSTDRGRTFSPPRQVLGRRKYGVRMAIDRSFGPQGRLHLLWLSTGEDPGFGGFPLSSNPILTAHSDDGGTVFSPPIQVSDASRSLVVAPALVLGAEHEVYVAYYDLQDDRRDYQGLEGPAWDGYWSLVVASSKDGGEHFTPGTAVDQRIVPPERVMLIFTMPPPSLVAVSADVYLSWWDGRDGDWDVWLARSSDRGRSWGEPVRVNDDNVANGRHQYMPRLSTAPGGRLDVIFYDRRDDPQNIRNSVYYAYSHDRGRTFSRNVVISSRSFFADSGSRYGVPSARGLVEFGSRIGLVSSSRGALAAWTDTRLSPRGYEQQDIFATRVVLAKERGRTILWLYMLGVFALFAGLGLVAVVGRRRRISLGLS